MGLPFPGGPEGDAWDTLSIGGIRYSGVAKVDGAKRTLRVDVRNRRGANGAALSIHGRGVAEPKITLTAWDEAQVEELEAIAERVFPSTRAARHDAVAVDHPVLTFHGITQVLVKEIDGPEVDDMNLVTMTLTCVEYRPPPPRAQASRRPAAAPEPSDIDPRIAEINQRNPIPEPPSRSTTAAAPPARPAT